MSDCHIYVGFDAKEIRAHNVATTSLRVHSGHAHKVQRICRLSIPRWYTRPTRQMANGLWDEISDAPMSTDHAIARFFIPWLRDYQGWALFTDGDVLFRRDIKELLDLRDERFAVQVVKHPVLTDEGVKKDGHYQLPYRRKNWSSVMLVNCGHPSNRKLTLDVVNNWPGRDLHGFLWLLDDEIGSLQAEWNYLVGVNEPQADPAIVHYTLGTPDVDGHENDPFAEEWFATARAAGYHRQVKVTMPTGAA